MKSNLRNHLSRYYSDHELRRWFDPLRVHFNEAAKQVEIAFPHVFFKQWFANEKQAEFEKRLMEYLGRDHGVVYGTGKPNTFPKRVVPHGSFERAAHQHSPQLFTFDTFLVNKKNAFPLATAKQVASAHKAHFSPLLLCGGPGCGKTHLLRAMVHDKVSAGEPDCIFLGTPEDMAALYKHAHQGDSLSARKTMQSYSALFLDDLHDAKRHPFLQEELVMLFNHFYDSEKQMAFTCLGRLSDHLFFSSELMSRLEWGLIVNLKAPDLDIRIRYAQSQCKIHRILLTRDQILTLAQRFTDFRYLQGVLLKLSAFRTVMKQELSERDFMQILDQTEGRSAPVLDTQTICKVVAKYYGLPEAELIGSRRHHTVVLARQVAMFLCRKLIRLSYPALGRAFGGKDHSTAMYAVKKIEQLQRDEKDLKHIVATLKNKCLSPADN